MQLSGTAFTLGPDVSTCADVPVTLDPGPVAGSLFWSTGDTSRRINVHTGGTYTLWVTDPLGCTSSDAITVSTRNCECLLYLPNAFSPNSDGINDALAVAMDCTPIDFHLDVFDRWGRAVHQSTDPASAWSGDAVPSGVYAYALTYSWEAQDGVRQVHKLGSVMVLR